jgi:hypothetical protein
MGLKTITTQASLEMGAYTWAKYGFAYKSDEDREVHIEGRPGVVPGVRENMQNLIRSTAGVQNLTSEQKREIKMIGDLLSTKDLRVNQMLVDLKTPALDELVSGVTQEYLQENSSFMKHVFYNTDYKARISLDKNSPDRKRMEAYIRARKSAPPKPGARKFDEAVKLGYTVVMKSKQQPTAGGDFHCLKNGTPSNGAVMNYLLGDEPDVAETSAELAKKLGLPEDLIKALGGK